MTLAPITLTLLPDAPDADGEPRAALAVPPAPGCRRGVLLVFASVALAVAEKSRREGGAA